MNFRNRLSKQIGIIVNLNPLKTKLDKYIDRLRTYRIWAQCILHICSRVIEKSNEIRVQQRVQPPPPG